MERTKAKAPDEKPLDFMPVRHFAILDDLAHHAANWIHEHGRKAFGLDRISEKLHRIPLEQALPCRQRCSPSIYRRGERNAQGAHASTYVCHVGGR